MQCGLYRTGNLWAHSKLPADCQPDMVTMAKPLANGYPIGAVLIRDSVAQVMTPGASISDKGRSFLRSFLSNQCIGTHGTTFGGSPLACALGFHVLVGRLEKLPKYFPKLLKPEVRGRGLILGLGFKDTTNPGRVVDMARERGVFLLTAGKDAVRLVPSLNVPKEDVDFAVDVLESVLSQM